MNQNQSRSLNFSRVKKRLIFGVDKGKHRRKKTDGFSLISFKLFIPPKSKPKARIIFKASITVPKKTRKIKKILTKLKIGILPPIVHVPTLSDDKYNCYALKIQRTTAGII